MPGHSRTFTYPPEGVGAPKDRHPGPLRDLGLPTGSEVVSADDHISLAEDIFHQRLPEAMRDRAPRVMNVDGGWVLGIDGTSILVPEFIEVLTQYDPLPGSHSGDVDARLAALDAEGVAQELAFPNSVLALFGWPDREVRELCFRIYNEHIAEVQERSGGRILGVGLINWWEADGARRTLRELKSLGLKTFLLPLSPGKDLEKRPIDYASDAMDGVWAAIEEAQVPVAHHIGETPPATPNQFNAIRGGDAPERRAVPRRVRQVHLRRHPRSSPGPADRLLRGWHQLGAGRDPGRAAHRRLVQASREPRDAPRPPALLGPPHVRVVHGRPARTRPDRPHRRRSRSCGRPTSRTTRAPTATPATPWRASSMPSAPKRPPPSLAATRSASWGWSASARRAHGRGAVDHRRRHGRPGPAMQRDRGERLRAIMREQGLDALVLLGNTNVAYATGAIWPLADSGRANFEQPVAVVLVDDPVPHLFSPGRDDDRRPTALPDDHRHGPAYLGIDEGVGLFARRAGRAGAAGGLDRSRRVDPRAAPRAAPSSSPKAPRPTPAR